MSILGVDPGSRHMGWGVVRREGTRLLHIAHGVIDVDTDAPFADRLCEIERELEKVVQAHRPSGCAVEAMFFGKDASAAAKLGHARGVALLVLARAGLAVAEYEPALVKRNVGGSGRSDKRQVAMIVSAMLHLSTPPRPDAADALAIAIMHANVSAVRARLVRMRRPAKMGPLGG